MSKLLKKKEVFTVVTPIPSFIPRRLALDILHSHSEVITLNPLVLGHTKISPPDNAAADEMHSTWYAIHERVQVIPGTGKVGAKEITFNGCFHDMPWGLQTHIYAPFGIDMRVRYRIAGNQPGVEAPEHRELGFDSLDVPADGLYLREDIEIRCNISIVSFVKAQAKAASKDMVDRIIRKAELLDSGALKAMMAPDGRLKTLNPNDPSQKNRPVSQSPEQQRMSMIPEPPQYPPQYADHQPHPMYARAPVTNQQATPRQYPTGPDYYNQFNQQYTASVVGPNEQAQQQRWAPPPMELPGDYYYQHGGAR
ncbi:unnamed protein product [Clonostachys solani]|uniref:DUF7053 domain-containing protein n=1 Tax=Clonostachys solani TaxID=160281 RepID=A0A9N9ZN17_9HYPO|nr:unnamed protein product [Clonostachys solani]